jgi:hypothetical protein
MNDKAIVYNTPCFLSKIFLKKIVKTFNKQSFRMFENILFSDVELILKINIIIYI